MNQTDCSLPYTQSRASKYYYLSEKIKHIGQRYEHWSTVGLDFAGKVLIATFTRLYLNHNNA